MVKMIWRKWERRKGREEYSASSVSKLVNSWSGKMQPLKCRRFGGVERSRKGGEFEQDFKSKGRVIGQQAKVARKMEQREEGQMKDAST